MGGEDYATASPAVRERIHATWDRLETLGYTVQSVEDTTTSRYPRSKKEVTLEDGIT